MIFLKVFLRNAYIISIVKKGNVILFGVLTTALLSRYLGPENMGQYSYILSVSNIAITILNLGVNQTYPNFKRRRDRDYLPVFLSLSIIIFTMLLILSVISFIFSDDIFLSTILLLNAIGVFRIQLIQYTLVEDIVAHSLATILSTISNFVMLVIVVLSSESNIYLALFVYILKELTVVLYSLFTLKKSIRPIEFGRRSYSLWGQIIKFGLIPTYTTLLVTLNYQVDVILLKNLSVDLTLLGLYSAGVSLAQYGWLIPDIFKDVMINKTAQKDDIQNMNFSLRVSSTMMIVVYIILLLFGKFLMRLLFGNEFLGGYPITLLIFLGIYSMIFTKIIGTLYIAKGKMKFYAMVLSLAVIINIGGNIWLIPYFNIYAAGATTVISYTIAGYIFLKDYKKTYNLSYKDLLIISKDDISLISNRILKK